MADAIEELVHFTVTVRSEERDGHWMTVALQSGVITYGDSREEAELKNGEANTDWVRLAKVRGYAALKAFMNDRDIKYQIGENPSFSRTLLPPTPPPLNVETAAEDRELSQAA